MNHTRWMPEPERWPPPIAAVGVRGRYAPSPTGRLHLGSLRTALLAWLQVRLAGGSLVLRMEDLDTPRVKPGSAEQLLDDLRWLGLDWDEGPGAGPAGVYTQSQRLELYREALAYLRARGLVFPCTCSRKEIGEASAPHGGTPIYPGTCRDRGESERDPTRTPAWRFRVGARTVAFEDRVLGLQQENLAEETGDFVLLRADGLFAYQLAVVVDDALMGITDVVRGADLRASAARQIALFEALGYAPPRFWHVPLLLDASGARMSKRDGSDSLQGLRERGLDAAAVIGMLAASLGWVPAGSRLSAAELLAELDQSRFLSGLRAPLSRG